MTGHAASGRLQSFLAAVIGAGVMLGGGAIAYGAMAATSTPAVRAAAASSAAVAPDLGNPKGHVHVPPAGPAVNTRHPNHVVGNGRQRSCTLAAVVRAVAAGGIITFNCGRKPVTIVMTSTASVIKTRHLVVLDGGGLITLSGGGEPRIL